MAAVKKNTGTVGLPLETKVELVATKQNEVFKKIMTYREALEKFKNKKKGFSYQIFQIGFSQFK
jgi:hypothetical protein